MATRFGTIFDPLNSKAQCAMDGYFDVTWKERHPVVLNATVVDNSCLGRKWKLAF